MDIGESLYSASSPGSNPNKAESLTLGVVKENWNALYPGMVKVVITTPNNGELESDWMPVMSPWAGKECGMYQLPDVGTTVVVGYLDDNSVSPVVLGCTWLKKGEKANQLPQNAANQKNNVKVFALGNGTMFRITQETDGDLVEILTKQKQSLTFNDKTQTLLVSSKEDQSQITLNGKEGTVTVDAKTSISLQIGGKAAFKLDQNGLEVNCDKITLKGQSLQSNASQTKLQGDSVEIKAQGSLKVESSGMAQVKGSMLKLN